MSAMHRHPHPWLLAVFVEACVLASTAGAQEFLAQTAGEDVGLFTNDGEEAGDASNMVDPGNQANFASFDDDTRNGSERGETAETERTQEVEQTVVGEEASEESRLSTNQGEEVSNVHHAVSSGDEASSATFDSGAVAENGSDDSRGTAFASAESDKAEGSVEATGEDEWIERVEGAGGRNAEEDMHDDLDEEASYEAAIKELLMMEGIDNDLPTTFAEDDGDEGEWV